MWPVLLTWRGKELHTYHVMIYLALLVTIWLTVSLGRGAGLDPNYTALTVLVSYVPGFLGARSLYVLRHWDRFGRDPSRIFCRSEGGLSLHGGIIGMFAGLFALCLLFGLPLAPFFDALVPAMLAGIAIAKGGCLLNGCCHGHATAHWCGLNLPDEHGVWRRRFPVQLMEMAWALLVLLIVMTGRGFSPPPGLMACAGLALLAAGRIFLQGLRDESAAENAAVRKSSLMLIAAALAVGLFTAL